MEKVVTIDGVKSLLTPRSLCCAAVDGNGHNSGSDGYNGDFHGYIITNEERAAQSW